MARIFITGSADGLGQLAAKELIEQGHSVVLHARNKERSQEALKKNPGAEAVLTADLANMEETKALAEEVNKLGAFDTIIHNAGVYEVSSKEILAINTLAPYILTFLIQKPKRLIYLTSGMQSGGHFNREDFINDSNRISYSDSKLHVVMLAKAVARRWPEVYSNAVDPGWVPTKMGGKNAPDELEKGYETQVWLAASEDEEAKVSGHYFHHKEIGKANVETDDVKLQEEFLTICKEITGVSFS